MPATDKERLNEWLRFYKASSVGYQVNALLAILENDGERMLKQALRELGLEDSLNLLKAMGKPQTYE